MSKGLGKIQLEIVNSLDAAMAGARYYYRGDGREKWYAPSGIENPANWKYDKPGWITHRGLRARLAPGYYDLRAVQMYMAEKNNQITHGHYVSAAYQASFSRAARELAKRNLLVFSCIIPVIDWDDRSDAEVLRLADGDYIITSERQRRFCTLSAICQISITLIRLAQKKPQGAPGRP